MHRKRHIFLLTLGIALAGGIFAVLAWKGIRIPCIFQLITGLNCPGCGNTRATMALLTLDFPAMLSYNLMYPFQILYLLHVYVICCKRYLQGERFSYYPRPGWLDIAFLVTLVLWTIVRNCTPIF